VGAIISEWLETAKLEGREIPGLSSFAQSVKRRVDYETFFLCVKSF